MRVLILAAALALPVPALASNAECRALQRTMERVAALADAVSEAATACQGVESDVCAGIERARRTMIEEGLLDPEALGMDMIFITALSVDICN